MCVYPGLSAGECSRLIVVDVQKQFISENTEHILSGIEAIIPKFEKVVLSQIEHDPDQYVFELKKWAPSPVGSEGHALALNLDSASTERIHITRKRFFSALTDDAQAFLGAEKGSSIYLCGMDTDLCVLQTGVDLMRQGFRPVILSKLCASYGGEALHRHALIQCKRFFGRDQVI
ncbi:MAG: cysteine hydrolase family protein [Opitutales bacterium]